MIRIHALELMRLAEKPMPWWDREARKQLELVVPGEPAAEVVFEDNDNQDGTPTGWFLLSYGSSAKDEYVLDMIRKRWEILDGDDPAQATAVEFQIEHDWLAWADLKSQLDRRSITPHQANDRIWEYVKTMGAAVGLPYVEPADDEE